MLFEKVCGDFSLVFLLFESSGSQPFCYDDTFSKISKLGRIQNTNTTNCEASTASFC